MRKARGYTDEKVGEDSTNATTRRLKKEYPPRTIIEFHDSDWQQRTGLVIGAANGRVLARSPAAVARMPKKFWVSKVRAVVDGKRVWVDNPNKREPVPRLHRVPEERVVRVLRRPRSEVM